MKIKWLQTKRTEIGFLNGIKYEKRHFTKICANHPNFFPFPHLTISSLDH